MAIMVGWKMPTSMASPRTPLDIMRTAAPVGSEPSTKAAPTHTYAAFGTYQATLKVTYADGEQATGKITVTVGCTAPDARPTVQLLDTFTGVRNKAAGGGCTINDLIDDERGSKAVCTAPAASEPVARGDANPFSEGAAMGVAHRQPQAKAYAKAMDPYEIRYWQAQKGDSLHQVLEKWSSAAGVQMFWRAPADFNLPTGIDLHGTFTDAVTEVLNAYNEAQMRPLGKLHPNLPDGPSVLVIDSETN